MSLTPNSSQTDYPITFYRKLKISCTQKTRPHFCADSALFQLTKFANLQTTLLTVKTYFCGIKSSEIYVVISKNQFHSFAAITIRYFLLNVFFLGSKSPLLIAFHTSLIAANANGLELASFMIEISDKTFSR